MATQIVMDQSGDTRHHFDATDREAVAKAEERFLSTIDRRWLYGSCPHRFG